MRVRSWLVTAALAGCTAIGADAPPTATGRATDLEIVARLINDKDALIKAVGSDLNRQYVIVEVTVKPRGGYPVNLSRDDFLLRSARDNERGAAESPDRIAGSAVLVLGSSSSSRPVYSESGDPVYVGGLPGTGGRPRRVGAAEDTFGGSVGGEGKATVAASATKATPLLATLKAKEMPLGETGKPVSGYLYFPVDPKQKTKNFYLHYKGPGGACDLHFK